MAVKHCYPEMYPITSIIGYPPGAPLSPHTDRVTRDLILVGVSWLLAAGSGVLWLRENPGKRLQRRNSPKRSWRSTALFFAALAVAAYGGSGLQRREHWGIWAVLAVVFSFSAITTGIPLAVRRWQLRRTTPQPAAIDSSAGIPPAV